MMYFGGQLLSDLPIRALTLAPRHSRGWSRMMGADMQQD
jgi:hypothetical protein